MSDYFAVNMVFSVTFQNVSVVVNLENVDLLDDEGNLKLTKQKASQRFESLFPSQEIQKEELAIKRLGDPIFC